MLVTKLLLGKVKKGVARTIDSASSHAKGQIGAASVGGNGEGNPLFAELCGTASPTTRKTVISFLAVFRGPRCELNKASD